MITKSIKWLMAFLLLPLLTACDWEDLPAYEDADITGVQVYYRWPSSTQKDAITGEPVVKQVRLNSSASVDAENCVVNVTVSVPGVSGNFPQDAWDACTQSKLWLQATISTAARLTPQKGSAALGTPDDWTVPHTYVVKAANGNKKTWTINVTGFTK